MDPFVGPPGPSRPKSPKPTAPLPPSSYLPSSAITLPIASPIPQQATDASWASSLAAGLFPASFTLPVIQGIPHGILPVTEAVQPAVVLHQPPFINNPAVTNLSGFPAPAPTDPWHIAHSRVCAHASSACAACSVAFVCCSCRSLRFTPGMAPLPPPPCPDPKRSRSASPALFRTDVGSGAPLTEWDSHSDAHDDEVYTRALAECDVCDNSSCPRGTDEPATWTIVIERFDEGTEEHYDFTLCACGACNRACKRSFMGHKIKSRTFDNSTRKSPASVTTVDNANTLVNPPDVITALQDSLRILNDRPPTPATFVATVRVKHDARCQHPVDSCPVCSLSLTCCSCKLLFAPATARHLVCTNCKHVASTCCTTVFCCKCSKIWMPTDSVSPVRLPARRFFGGAGSNSSPEPDICTPSPHSSPDEIDDLTTRANVPLPISRSESDASCAPSHASSVDMPVNVAATPLPTPDFSSLSDDLIDGLIHPSFPDRAILDTSDKRHFLGRGDLSVTSLKLYARRIFTETSHWITVGHFLIDIFQGTMLNGSRDDFCWFVILVGTQLGYGDLAQSMSESLDVNRKMADEYMHLHDVATSWKQKAKTNSKDAKAGRHAQEELSKARGDITAILEEREIFIQQQRKFMARDDRLTTELSRVHRDYGNAIEDNAKFAANAETLEQADSTWTPGTPCGLQAKSIQNQKKM